MACESGRKGGSTARGQLRASKSWRGEREDRGERTYELYGWMDGWMEEKKRQGEHRRRERWGWRVARKKQSAIGTGGLAGSEIAASRSSSAMRMDEEDVPVGAMGSIDREEMGWEKRSEKRRRKGPLRALHCPVRPASLASTSPSSGEKVRLAGLGPGRPVFES